ncbi:MAG: hypothetical protein JNJ71_05035 [Rubrivivax sp.]|nr:hypothetical protein [Rubrivivax sp.]
MSLNPDSDPSRPPPAAPSTQPPASAAEAAAASSRPAPRTRLRALNSDDHEAVQALFRRHGWPVRSRSGWDWALIDSPARRATGADAGWVLEHGDDVVGVLGNLPQSYHLDGLPVWGATCTSYLVDDAHRAHSTRLLRAFAAQPGAAFVFSATANPHSAPVYRAFRFQPSPQPRAHQRLRWLASESAAAGFALQRAHLGLLKPLAPVLALPRSAARRWRDRHLPSARDSGLHLSRVTQTDLATASSHWPCTWDSWADGHRARPGLWLDRSAATMAWRLADPDLHKHLAAWALRDGDGRMLGMCLARRVPDAAGTAPRVELMDWALNAAAPEGSGQQLLHALLRWARDEKAAVVDAKRWTGDAATQLETLQPLREELPVDAVWLLAHQHASGPGIEGWPSWGMTGVDSDDWFNSHLKEAPADALPWSAPPQPPREADNSRTRSSMDSTAAGSKRSMSTA